MHFHSQERSKMATYCSSIPECCVTEVKVSIITGVLVLPEKGTRNQCEVWGNA